MANARRVDTATEADWSFMQDDEAVAALERAARRAVREFEQVSYEDAYNEGALWLAVRPERYAKAADEADYRSLGFHIYSHGLREPAITEKNRRNATVYVDAFDEGLADE